MTIYTIALIGTVLQPTRRGFLAFERFPLTFFHHIIIDTRGVLAFKISSPNSLESVVFLYQWQKLQNLPPFYRLIVAQSLQIADSGYLQRLCNNQSIADSGYVDSFN